jgi:hypothetical protein
MMSAITVGAVLIWPLALLFYCSGLLLWPIRRWWRRKRKVRGKALLIVFWCQISSYTAVGVMGFFFTRLVEHPYQWFIVLIFVNIIFTPIGLIAWARDEGYETSLSENQTS